ncbi:MAG: dUTP diphosphatase [Kiritimatiellae bacterium]|nr:dUTP diphosphatase [Kiritimatiellia bacterium]
MVVRFKRIDRDAVLPAYAHPGDAGMDICSVEELVLPPGKRSLIRTGLVMELPDGYEAQVRPRSGLALKHGVTVLNSPGTIDAGYRGEVGVILVNHGDSAFSIRKGDRIAQLVVAPVTAAEVEEVASVAASERGAGGFGSTGV